VGEAPLFEQFAIRLDKELKMSLKQSCPSKGGELKRPSQCIQHHLLRCRWSQINPCPESENINETIMSKDEFTHCVQLAGMDSDSVTCWRENLCNARK